MDPSIAGIVFEGEPYDAHTWSGCSPFFFRALESRGILAAAVSAKVSAAQSLLLRAATVHPDVERWKFREGAAVMRRAMRTRDGMRKIATIDGSSYNTILQIGAFYDFTNQPGKRTVSYNDTNLFSVVSEYPRRAKFSCPVIRSALAYEAQLHRRMDVVFTMSRWAADSFVRDLEVEAKKVEPIGAGINFESPPAVANKSYDSANVLFVGRDFSRKGGHTLLEAFARVRRLIPTATLTLAGAEHVPDLPPGVRSLGFISKRTEAGRALLRSAYETAAVFALPSHWEPFGISILEAQAHGLPCVGTDAGAMPELIAASESGLVVPRYDSVALANALIELLKDPAACRQLGERGRARQQQYYTWDAVARRMHQRLEQCV